MTDPFAPIPQLASAKPTDNDAHRAQRRREAASFAARSKPGCQTHLQSKTPGTWANIIHSAVIAARIGAKP